MLGEKGTRQVVTELLNLFELSKIYQFLTDDPKVIGDLVNVLASGVVSSAVSRLSPTLLSSAEVIDVAKEAPAISKERVLYICPGVPPSWNVH